MNNLIPGTNTLLSSENIAIVALMFMVLSQWGLIWYLLKQHFNVVEEAKKAFEEVLKTLIVLNDRIGRH